MAYPTDWASLLTHQSGPRAISSSSDLIPTRRVSMNESHPAPTVLLRGVPHLTDPKGAHAGLAHAGLAHAGLAHAGLAHAAHARAPLGGSTGDVKVRAPATDQGHAAHRGLLSGKAALPGHAQVQQGTSHARPVAAHEARPPNPSGDAGPRWSPSSPKQPPKRPAAQTESSTGETHREKNSHEDAVVPKARRASLVASHALSGNALGETAEEKARLALQQKLASRANRRSRVNLEHKLMRREPESPKKRSTPSPGTQQEQAIDERTASPATREAASLGTTARQQAPHAREPAAHETSEPPRASSKSRRTETSRDQGTTRSTTGSHLRRASPPRKSKEPIYCGNNAKSSDLLHKRVRLPSECIQKSFGAALRQKVADVHAFLQKFDGPYEKMIDPQLWYSTGIPIHHLDGSALH